MRLLLDHGFENVVDSCVYITSNDHIDEIRKQVQLRVHCSHAILTTTISFFVPFKRTFIMELQNSNLQHPLLGYNNIRYLTSTTEHISTHSQIRTFATMPSQHNEYGSAFITANPKDIADKLTDLACFIKKGFCTGLVMIQLPTYTTMRHLERRLYDYAVGQAVRATPRTYLLPREETSLDLNEAKNITEGLAGYFESSARSLELRDLSDGAERSLAKDLKFAAGYLTMLIEATPQEVNKRHREQKGKGEANHAEANDDTDNDDSFDDPHGDSPQRGTHERKPTSPGKPAVSVFSPKPASEYPLAGAVLPNMKPFDTMPSTSASEHPFAGAVLPHMQPFDSIPGASKHFVSLGHGDRAETTEANSSKEPAHVSTEDKLEPKPIEFSDSVSQEFDPSTEFVVVTTMPMEALHKVNSHEGEGENAASVATPRPRASSFVRTSEVADLSGRAVHWLDRPDLNDHKEDDHYETQKSSEEQQTASASSLRSHPQTSHLPYQVQMSTASDIVRDIPPWQNHILTVSHSPATLDPSDVKEVKQLTARVERMHGWLDELADRMPKLLGPLKVDEGGNAGRSLDVQQQNDEGESEIKSMVEEDLVRDAPQETQEEIKEEPESSDKFAANHLFMPQLHSTPDVEDVVDNASAPMETDGIPLPVECYSPHCGRGYPDDCYAVSCPRRAEELKGQTLRVVNFSPSPSTVAGDHDDAVAAEHRATASTTWATKARQELDFHGKSLPSLRSSRGKSTVLKRNTSAEQHLGQFIGNHEAKEDRQEEVEWKEDLIEA